MSETVLVGRGRQITPIPRQEWERHLSDVPQHQEARLAFMSADHHRARYFVVKELARTGAPIPPEFIAQELMLPLAQVQTILEDLEKHLLFLVRNEQGAVSWAFPITIDTTPHHLTFNTGEQVYAAGAEDAMATPFVQGRLRQESLVIEIRTTCAHCAWPIHIVVDSDLRYHIQTAEAMPLIFEPHINWETFAEPNIIHAYGHNSLFFWSEEHAREFRAEADHVDGVFLTLQQSAYSTQIVQGALFAFKPVTLEAGPAFLE